MVMKMQYEDEIFDLGYRECFTHKCCGCCRHFAQGRIIVPDRAPAMGGDEIAEGICGITGYSTTNRTTQCKQWSRRDSVTVL